MELTRTSEIGCAVNVLYYMQIMGEVESNIV